MFTIEDIRESAAGIMDTAVKKIFILGFVAILLAISLVNAVSLERVSKRVIHEYVAGDPTPSLSIDNAAKIFSYWEADPVNADQNIFSSDVGGIFATALAARPGGSDVGRDCYNDAECGTGKKCSYYKRGVLDVQPAGKDVKGVCIDSCLSDSGCLDYEACADSNYPLIVRPANADIGGVCVDSCSVNTDCDPGEKCSYFGDNLIVRPAAGDSSITYRGVCVQETIDEEPECVNDNECQDGNVCVNGECVEEEQTSIEPSCGDLNADGVRDVLDVNALISNVYRNGPAPNPAWIGDVDGDGYIDKFDIAALSNHVFKGAPEPTCSGGVHCEGDYCGKAYVTSSNYSCGDLTGDSKVTEKDVDKLSRYVFAGETISNLAKADLNGDNTADVLDVVLMISYYYRNGPAPSCSPKPTECGDLNKDGVINDNDIQKISDYIFSGQTPSNWVLTDLNGDCSYDVLDVTLLVSYVKRNGAKPVCGGEICGSVNNGKVYTATVSTCGNIDKDSDIDKFDVDKLRSHIFEGESLLSGVNADLNGDNILDVLDVVALVNYVYRNGSAPNCPEVYVENKAPVSLAINGPTKISDFGVSASWQISASDPEGGNLTYIIYFGDGQSSEYRRMLSGVPKTVSHTYNKPTPNAVAARYKMRFIAKDELGSQAEIEQDINVGITNPGGGDGGGTPSNITITSPLGGTFTVGGVMPISWTAPSTVSTATLYLMKRLFDGSYSSALIATGVPSSGRGSYNFVIPDNVVTSLGLYSTTTFTQAQVIGRDSATGDYLSKLSNAFTIVSANKGFSNGQNLTIIDNRDYTGVPAELVGVPVIQSIENINDQTIVKRQLHGSTGKIIGGPQYLTIPDSVATKWNNVETNNWRGWFWKVHFDSGVEGWVDEFYLKPAFVTNVFKITADSLVNPVNVYVGENNIWFLKTNAIPDIGCSGSVNYEIDWGDNTPKSTSAEGCFLLSQYGGFVNRIHTYARNGTFIIRGKATSTMTDWTGTATKNLNVIANYKPITISKFEVQGRDTKGMIKQLRILASGGAPGDLTFKINWGDGTADSTYTGKSGVTNNPTHSYASIGNWNPTLTITDSVGQITAKQLYNPSSIRPPVVTDLNCPSSYTITPTTSWLTCTFKITDPEGKGVSYTIDWEGDGVVDYVQDGDLLSGYTHTRSKQCSTASCTKPQSGVWTVTVRARDGSWWWSNPVTKTISVS